MEQSQIIAQHFERYESLQSYLEDNPVQENPFLRAPKTVVPEDLLGEELMFVIGEPGYGKSTLLQGTAELLKERNIKFQLVEGGGNEPPVFQAEISYLLYDALDENRSIVATFHALLTHCTAHSIGLIVSNRSHYMEKILHLLHGSVVKVTKLLAFDDYQIEQFLQDRFGPLDYSHEDILSITSLAKANDRSSILKVPRYLNEFCRYVIEEKLGPGQIGSLNRSDLFDKVIFYKLEHDDKKGQENQKHLTKRVLERLALTMEMHGTNQITKDEFITFLDQSQSNISLIFLNLVDLDSLVNRVLKSTGDILHFEHTEFQEYLAAKELVRLGHRYQNIYDIMIDPGTELMQPHWADVLGFALDIDPEFVRPVVSFIETGKYSSSEEKLLSAVAKADLSGFDQVYRNHCFGVILQHYTRNAVSIINIAPELAGLPSADNVLLEAPEKDFSDNQRLEVTNRILIIEAMATKKLLSENRIGQWTPLLIHIAKTDALFAMHSTAYYALIAFGNPEPVLSQMEYFEQRPDYILNEYLRAAFKLSADDQRTVALIQRCIATRRRVDNLDSAINSLRSERSICSILETLSKSAEVLQSEKLRFGGGYYRLFETIAELDSPKVTESLAVLVKTVFATERYNSGIPKFLEHAIAHLFNKDSSIIAELMELEGFWKSSDDLVKAMGHKLGLKEFKLIEKALIDKGSSWRLERMITAAKQRLDGFPENPISKYLENKYPAAEKIPAVQKKDHGKHILELRRYFVKDRTKYNTGLIPFFVQHFPDLIPQLSESDRLMLGEVADSVLENYDPCKLSLSIVKRETDRISYRHNSTEWLQIEMYFKAALQLDRKDLLKKHRNKLIMTAPRLDVYHHSHPKMERSLLEEIGNLSQGEAEMLSGYLNGRKDDLLVHSAREFAEVCIQLKLNGLTPILLALIKNPNISEYDQLRTLEAFGELATSDSDRDALQRLFDEERKKPNLQLATIANAYLVSRFRDGKAIQWRIADLKSRIKKFDDDHKYSGIRGVSDLENEMDRPQLGKCLLGIGDADTRRQMLGLLQFSFDIRGEKLYFPYSTYLQHIVQAYFRSIIDSKSIELLKRTIAVYPEPRNTYSFTQHLGKLIVDLAELSPTNESFLTSIHSLNLQLAKRYLPINSHEELRELVLSTLNTEIRNLIENEGLYSLSGRTNASPVRPALNESLIQKTLKIALEKALLEKGLRKADIHREVQIYDDKRFDYLISYGLYGPIVVELKLLHNPEIQIRAKREAYRPKIQQYLLAARGLGIYAVFKVKDNKSHITNYKKMTEGYAGISGLDHILIDCTAAIGSQP
ncbi:MAG: hypothetical protein REI78_02775 [Pedobacter sp.]|nr:hypothetical protein [Pedobacter sp.]